jgi:uncharacterized radical SAM superfamily Fe-S cluster-containing enzyme
MTKLQAKSRMHALNVMKGLYKSNIIQIHTRGALDRFIEIEKFPETKKICGFYKRTVYKNQQYDSIRNWLINQGFITSFFDGYRYHYQVVKCNISLGNLK